MPQTTTKTNGHSNGTTNGHHVTYETEDGSTFLFTSESVGEGHPGN